MMNAIQKTYVLLLVVLVTSLPLHAKPLFLVRPQASYGYLHMYDSEGVSGGAFSYGARVLIGATETQRFGIDVSQFHIQNSNSDMFTSVGIVLEQKVGGWFSMTVGTVGYFGFGADSRNVIGITTNLGWEPSWKKMVKPYVTYRTDFIFSEHFTLVNSLNAGCTFEFGGTPHQE